MGRSAPAEKIGDKLPRRRPCVPVEFRRRNLDAEIARHGQEELDGAHGIKDLEIVEREVGIPPDLVGLGYLAKHIQYLFG